MGAHVGGVFKLARDDAVPVLRVQAPRLFDGALHALFAVGEHELCAEGGQQPAPLGAHGLGHGQDERIALDGAQRRDEVELVIF